MTTQTPKLTKKEKFLAGFWLLALVAITVLLSPLSQRIQTQYSISQFLPETHPLIKKDIETRHRFFIDQVQPILFTLSLDSMEKAPGDWLETERLARLEKVTDALSAELQPIRQVLSLGNVQGASQTDGDYNVGRLLALTSVEDRRARVLKDPMFSPLILSQDARTTLVVVSTPEISNEVIGRLSLRGQEILQKEFPEAKVEIGGVPALQWQLTDLVSHETAQFLGLALLASLFTLLLVFRTPSTVVMPVLIIAMVNVLVLCMIGWAGFQFTVLSITVPVLVTMNALALSTHTIIRFAEAVRGRVWSSRTEPVNFMLKNLLLPNFLTAFTTGVGFATLTFSNVPMIREYGVTVALSVLLSWFCTSLCLYPLLLIFPTPEARAWTRKSAGWSTWVLKHRRAIVMTVAMSSLAMVLVGQNLQWSARLFDDLPANQEARRTTEHIDRELGGMIPLEIILEQRADAWNDPILLSKLDTLLKSWRHLPGVGSAISLPDLVRQAATPRDVLPATRQGVAELYFLLSLSEDSMLKQFLTSDGAAARVALRLRDIPAVEMKTLMANLEKQAQEIFPQAKVKTAGMATTVHELNNELSRELLIGFWHALTGIAFVLLFVFRSWRWTLVAVVPNLVPAAILLGILALVKTPIKPGVALVFSIALGIAFDNTVYLMCRLRELQKKSPKGILPVESMLASEGMPCLISSLCLFSGFGIFLMSYFSINQTFGFYMLVSLTFGLLGDLIFMPALVSWFPAVLGASRQEPSVSDNDRDSGSSGSNEERDMIASISKVAAVLALIFVPLNALAAPTADDILKSVEKHLQTKDETARIKMKIFESNGGTPKERELEIKRKSGDKQQVLVRLQAPSDVKGIALLSIFKDGNEDQWLYLPSAKKPRRIVSSNRSQKFLDSEFNLEDFSASTYMRFQNKILREEKLNGAPVSVVESLSKSDESSYSRVLTWVNTVSFQVLKSEYYDKEGKLLKTMQFKNYKKFGKETWRAQIVEVQNVQTKRSTILKVVNLKLNTGLSDAEFSQSALE